jgi:hypothetical protein
MAVYYDPFFAFITPNPIGYDIYYNCGHMFLGEYITFSGFINNISSNTLNYIANVNSDIQAQFNSIVSNVSSITQEYKAYHITTQITTLI